MKVKDLVETLHQYPKDMPVVIEECSSDSVEFAADYLSSNIRVEMVSVQKKAGAKLFLHRVWPEDRREDIEYDKVILISDWL